MMLLLAAGCEMFPEDESIAPQEGAVPTIATADVGDNGFKVTITPAEGTGFYGYLITDERTNVTGTGLTSVSYEGIVSGNADATDEKTSALEIVFSGKTVTVNNGKPAQLATTIQAGTKYYIYAAGNSEQGIASVVAADSVWTTDAAAPDLSKSKVTATDTSVVIAMNTVVKRGTGKVYYTVYDATGGAVANLSKIEAPASAIKVDGKNVTFHTPDSVGVKPNRIPTPGGAIIGLSWDKGAFTNCAQEPKEIEALNESKPEPKPIDYYNLNGAYGKSGVIYRVPVKPWDIKYPNVENTVNGKKVLRSTENDTTLTNNASFIADGTAIVKEVAGIEPASTLTLSYQTDESEDVTTKKIVFDYSTVVLLSAEDDTTINIGPAIPAAEVLNYMTSITIPEGALLDAYGNPNAEFVSNYNFVAAAKVDIAGLEGNYLLDAIAKDTINRGISLAGGPTVVISELDKEKSFGGLKCNIKIENLLYAGSVLNAVYYEEIGQIQIPAGQLLGTEKDKTVDGYFDEDAKPDKDGKYPLKKFDATMYFDTPDRTPLILSVNNENGVQIATYSPASTYTKDATWTLIVKDGQNPVINPLYTVPATTLTATN